MRTKDVLKDIEEYSIFMQYLYLGETIKFNNGMTTLELVMDEELEIYAKNLLFPNLPPLLYSNDLSLTNVLFGIIPKLKKEKPEKHNCFSNRWEEIKERCLIQLSLNLS